MRRKGRINEKIKLNENTSTFVDYEMNHDMRVELTKKQTAQLWLANVRLFPPRKRMSVSNVLHMVCVCACGCAYQVTVSTSFLLFSAAAVSSE